MYPGHSHCFSKTLQAQLHPNLGRLEKCAGVRRRDCSIREGHSGSSDTAHMLRESSTSASMHIRSKGKHRGRPGKHMQGGKTLPWRALRKIREKWSGLCWRKFMVTFNNFSIGSQSEDAYDVYRDTGGTAKAKACKVRADVGAAAACSSQRTLGYRNLWLLHTKMQWSRGQFGQSRQTGRGHFGLQQCNFAWTRWH